MTVKFLLPTNCKLLKGTVLPSDNRLLDSCIEEKQILKFFCYEYISYHAFLNDCILYRNEYANKDICSECGNDRYLLIERNYPLSTVGVTPNKKSQLDLSLFVVGNPSEFWPGSHLWFGVYRLWTRPPMKVFYDKE
jgi:hypothetical protein